MSEALEIRVELLDGKYTYIWSEDGRRHEALRHGEPWRDLTGDGFVLAMGQKIDELSIENHDLKAQIDELKRQLENDSGPRT